MLLSMTIVLWGRVTMRLPMPSPTSDAAGIPQGSRLRWISRLGLTFCGGSTWIFRQVVVDRFSIVSMTTIWIRPGIIPAMRTSSPEVSSSSSPPGVVTASVGSLVSPPHSLGSSDIGEVDIDLFDLDLNAYPSRMPPIRLTSSGHGPCSDTSSISGNLFMYFKFILRW